MHTKKMTLALLAALGAACSGARVDEERPVAVRAAPVTVTALSDEVSGFGALSFSKKVDIGAAQEGSLAELRFREGDTVNAGDIVAVMRNPQLTLATGRAQDAKAQAEAALRLARSQLLEGRFSAEAKLLSLEKAELELLQSEKALEEQRHKAENQEVLFAAGALSPESIREVRFGLDAAEEEYRLMQKALDINRIGSRDEDLAAAGLPVPEDSAAKRQALIGLAVATLAAEAEAAEANLAAAARELVSMRLMEAELVVRSPSRGIVGARYVEEGEKLKKDDSIITLIDTESLYAVFPLREEDALRVEKDMPVRVSLDGTGGTYGAKVDLVYPQGDSQSFTFQVRALLERPAAADGGAAPDWKLKPGMFARASVEIAPPRQALLVPETALIEVSDGAAKLFTVNGSTATSRRVGLGTRRGDQREIVSGLSAGEVVVLRPDASMKDGVYVSMGGGE
ncbi:MAG: efflux RND transporter periplasmic adaptor subunit [Treponema sp.]|jgi:RND family efflux transporter MFP subunit|nr:efflux RND transporter periplasmic adaptor subunit [Treponema sp.]